MPARCMKICQSLGRGVSSHDCDSVEEVRDPNNEISLKLNHFSVAAVAERPMRLEGNETRARDSLMARKAWCIMLHCSQELLRRTDAGHTNLKLSLGINLPLLQRMDFVYQLRRLH